MDGANIPRKLKLPSHVLDFCCAQCGECCTNKWKIDVDAISYDKLYKKFEELGRQQEFHDNIRHDKQSRQIRFLPNGKCPYLSENNLCSIQLEVGEDYLPDICKVFPRTIFSSPHTLEFSLSLACKAAIKTLQYRPISIIETKWPIENRQDIPLYFTQPNAFIQYYPDKPLFENLNLPYYVVENCFIELLQDQTYPISKRLVTLGQVLSRLISSNAAKVGDNVTLVESILNDNQYATLEPNWKRHLEQLYQMANIFLVKFSSLAISKLLRSILLALSDEKPHQTRVADGRVCIKVQPPHQEEYQRKLEKYYRPVCTVVEPILENYLVNYILNKHFYLKPLHFAYYRMSYAFAAITAISIGYGILSNQPVSQQIILQSIYDVESIFFNNWFYPFISFLQGGKDYLLTIEEGIILANI